MGTSTAGHTAGEVDYLCDGTDDHVEIQQAVDDAATFGGLVLILEGEYHFDDKVTVAYGPWGATLWPQSVAIAGMGTGTMLIADSAIDSFFDISDAGPCRVSDLYLLGMDLAANGIDATGAGAFSGFPEAPVIDGVYFSRCTVGLRMYGQYFAVRGCFFDDNGTGILNEGASDCTINGCVILGNGVGIRFAQFSNDNQIVGCAVVSNQTNGLVIEADAEGNLIVGCDLTASPPHLITGQFTKIANCDFDSGGHGLELIDANDCTIVTNTFTGSAFPDNTYDHINISGDSNRNLITANLFRTSASFGMRYAVNIVDSTCDDNIVVGNDMQGWAGVAPINDAGTGTLLNYPSDATYGDNFT